MIANTTNNNLQSTLLTEYLLPLLDPTGWMLVHSVWQLGLIAILFFVARTVVRVVAPKNNAAIIYSFGCICLAAMLLVPAVTFMYYLNHQGLGTLESRDLIAFEQATDSVDTQPSLFSHPLAPMQAGAKPGTLDKPVESTMSIVEATSWPAFQEIQSQARSCFPWLISLWVAGVALLSLRPMFGLLNVWRLRRTGISPLPDSVRELGQATAQRLGINRAVLFVRSTWVAVPTVVGFAKPVVLLPAAVVAGLTTHELDLILAHELAHVRRNDYLMNLAQAIIETLLFFHPAVWIVSNQVRAERENCCDDLAVRMSGNPDDPAALAKALLALEQTRSISPALGAVGNGKNPLIKRIRRLIGQPTTQKSQVGNICFSFVMIVICFSVAFIFMLSPESDTNTLSAQQPTQTPIAQAEVIELVTADPESQRQIDQQLIDVQYCVVDLVVPVSSNLFEQPDLSQKQNETIPQQFQDKDVDHSFSGAMEGTRVTLKNGEPLIELITSTVAADDWQKGNNGGKLMLKFLPATLRLMVSAPQNVQDQVRELLEKLREVNDNTIEVQSSFLTLPKADLQLVNIHEDEEVLGQPVTRTQLSGRELRRIQALAVANSTWVTHKNPDFCLFNGQEWKFGWKGLEGLEPGYVKFLGLLDRTHMTGRVNSRIGIFTVDGQQLSTQVSIARHGIGLVDISPAVLPEDTDKAVLFFYRMNVINNAPAE